jgi:hypothetical protein
MPMVSFIELKKYGRDSLELLSVMLYADNM